LGTWFLLKAEERRENKNSDGHEADSPAFI